MRRLWVILVIGGWVMAQTPSARPAPAPKAKPARKAAAAPTQDAQAGHLSSATSKEAPTDQEQLAKELRRKRKARK